MRIRVIRVIRGHLKSFAILLSAMKRIRIVLSLAFTGVLLTLASAHAQNALKSETAFDKFWRAQSPAEAEKLVDDIAKSGITFENAWTRLKAGREYTSQK